MVRVESDFLGAFCRNSVDYRDGSQKESVLFLGKKNLVKEKSSLALPLFQTL